MFNNNTVLCAVLSGLSLFLVTFFMPADSRAEKAVCARVKIEIEQELTLERSAFDARMTINNGLQGLDLENVEVQVNITDAEGEDASALFFVNVFELTNISDVSGTGKVVGGTSAEIHWLIIPAVGAGGESSDGQIYYVGATLRYILKGDSEVTEVIPDAVVVKPQPSLVLDYFYPQYVLGDDPFTMETEPAVPYTMGVRVSNNGFGAARNVAIASAQPTIKENEQGLLIDFTILNSYVEDEAVRNSLNLNFGDIEPSAAKMGRWNAVCSLMGEFIKFEAEFTHSDELGGELTSLIEEVRPHFLIHDVLIDIAGADTVKDFLALDGSVIRVYGSDNGDEEVTAYLPGSSEVMVSGSPGSLEQEVDIDVPATDGPLYVKINEPTDNTLPVVSVVRADGKQLDQTNFWVSHERDGNHDWHNFLNIFDYDTPGGYVVAYGYSSGDGELEVSPESLDFSSVLLGQSVTEYVALTNVGTGPLTITGVSLAGGSAGEFSFSFDADLPVILDVDDQHNAAIIFTPTEVGARSGTLVITTDTETFSVPLAAMGDMDKDGDGIGDSIDLCDNRHEPDNDFASATPLSEFPFVSLETCVDTTDDVDYYSFSAEKGYVIKAVITSQGEDLEAIMGVFDPCGNLVALNGNQDDDGPGISAVLPVAGEYFLAVSARPDYSLSGAGESSGPYTLELNVGPNYADLDNDYDSDGLDAVIFSTSFGLSYDDPGYIEDCDYFDDDLVGPDDLAFFSEYYGLVTPAALLPADTDHDADVDGVDLGHCAAAYGALPGEPQFNPGCDFNKDGKIDQADLAVVSDNFAADACQ
jgi:hypothetical protein